MGQVFAAKPSTIRPDEDVRTGGFTPHIPFVLRGPQELYAPLMLGLLLCLWGPSAHGLGLELVQTQTPRPGLLLEQYRTSNPGANVWVTRVDVCAPRIWVDATSNPSGLETTGSWASNRGVQAAINGDFYTLSPRLHVYGQAVGDGVAWPLRKTGVHDDYAEDWYFRKYGWVAFGPDWVDYTYTKWVKANDELFPPLRGYRPNQANPPIPAGTVALISGFPTLVVEGQPITCASPTASSCFPDRSDMRNRHPRSAVGVSADRKTLMLVVVDGRTSQSSGMYGVELASLMHQLGAFFALNLDGGGSSQMWLSGHGYVNDRVGNNGGNGTRSVANHLGVFAGAAGGMPFRPGHCIDAAPCQLLSAEGGVVDDDSSCFHAYGPEVYWREESAGHGDGLHWTNATSASSPMNWAWWQLFLSEAGEYEVEFWAEPGYGRFERTRYSIRHAGRSDDVSMDQSADSGWRSLGTFEFAAGGQQWVAVYDDDPGDVPSGQHIVADAIRLRRIWPAEVDAGPGTPPEVPMENDAGAHDDEVPEPDAGEATQDAGGVHVPQPIEDAGFPPADAGHPVAPPIVDNAKDVDGGIANDAGAGRAPIDGGSLEEAQNPSASATCEGCPSYNVAWMLPLWSLTGRMRRSHRRSRKDGFRAVQFD